MASKDLFSVKAVGITRQISPWDTMVYSTVNPGLMYALVYLMWAPFLYPGGHMVWAIVTVAQMFVIAGLYWLLSCAMPRQGGEYIYISRILHPVLGLMSSFMISFAAISWTGVCTDWWLKYSLSDFFVGLAAIHNFDEKWINLANFFMTTHVRAVIGTIAILFIAWVFYRGTKAMVKLAWIALAGTLMGAIVYIVATFLVDQAVFAANWTQITGLNYDDVIKTAVAEGHPVKFLFGATIMAGSTYIILNTLGATFGANLAGEVRNVQKSQLLALFGSLGLLMAIWAIFYGMSYKAWGTQWTNCLMFLCGTGNDAYTSLPIGKWEPFATIMIAIMTKSGIFVFLIALAFFMATFGSTAGMSFGPIRNIYAWAFDRLVPEALAKLHPKTSQPWYASLVALIGAEIFLLIDIYLPSWTANIAYTIFTWFIGWIFLGIAGMVFPWRCKILYESSPPVVKGKFLGIPVVSILGFLTLLISVTICVYLLIPFFQGLLPYTMVVMSVALFIIPAIMYYYSKKSYAKKKIDIDIQFREIPSD
ncbi:APC family permease [Candidatus Formimonas warabiya]|uniref:APC family permease n=1 Tax=Formimonas warabiya TaxID=1761012 RepID=A0A3G1KZX8_FORW1|nr:APC family permease [Candidatus Formimonas warabiya]ATW27785.1 hypothetical protein DCMF_26230 [Candidatus Formimonas warabiya]